MEDGVQSAPFILSSLAPENGGVQWPFRRWMAYDMQHMPMMNVEAEVSLYPLAEEHLVHPVHDFVEVLKQHGCEVEIAPMSSIVKGESSAVFEALRIGYEAAAQKSACLLVIKACNVCPL